MHTLTARIDDHLFQETKKCAHSQGIVVSEYLRLALQQLNTEHAKRDRHKRLQQASLDSRADSQGINAEFAAFEGDDFG